MYKLITYPATPLPNLAFKNALLKPIGEFRWFWALAALNSLSGAYNKGCTFLHHTPVSVDWLYCARASGPKFRSETYCWRSADCPLLNCDSHEVESSINPDVSRILKKLTDQIMKIIRVRLGILNLPLILCNSLAKVFSFFQTSFLIIKGSYNILQELFTRRHSAAHRNRKAWDFPGGTVVKNLPANVGDTGSSPGLGRSHMPWSN